MFPYPFTISASVAVLFCFISKFHTAGTFLSGSIYSIVSVFEVLAHGYFSYLLW